MLNRTKTVASQVSQQLQQFASKETPNYTVSAVAAGFFLGVALVSELEGARISTLVAIASTVAATASATNQYVDRYDAKSLCISLSNTFSNFFKNNTVKQPEVVILDNAATVKESVEAPKLS